MRKNKRTEHRVRLELEATISIKTVSVDNKKIIEESIIPCIISDLSIGGAKIALTNHGIISPNSKISLYIKTSKLRRAIEMQGIIRWQKKPPGSPSLLLGIEFLVPPRKILKRWLKYARGIIGKASPEDLTEEPEAPNCPWSGIRD